MKLVITGGASPLGRALKEALGGEHEVAAPDGDVRDPEAARQMVTGADAVVHLAPLWPQAAGGASQGSRGSGSAQEWLDEATRGTYVLLLAAVAAGVGRVVLGSTLQLLGRYPAAWAVDESWRPRPDVGDAAAPGQLAAFLAELSAQQIARVEPVQVVCLRLGEVVDEATVAGRAYDPSWLHVRDAVQAVRLALSKPLRGGGEHAASGTPHGWWVFHVPGAGPGTRFPLAGAADPERGLGYAPTHAFPGSSEAESDPPPAGGAAPDMLDVLAPRDPVPTRPIRSVVIFGAGGPLAAAAARALAPAYRLRLTDLRPLEEVAREGKPQSPGAPLPDVAGPPHETRVVDVTDPAQVLAACEGMDAVVNCTVVRPHPVAAFRVNTLGAINVARAAAAHRIRRVVQTGPLQVLNDRPAGYWWDFAVPDDAPPRPGSWLYTHSKYLGQEAMRVFAEHYGLEVAVLLFCNFVNPAVPRDRLHPMTVSWEDAGLAVRRAVEAPALPGPFELLHILADLPHGKYDNAKAKRLLGWQPRDDLAHLYRRA